MRRYVAHSATSYWPSKQGPGPSLNVAGVSIGTLSTDQIPQKVTT